MANFFIQCPEEHQIIHSDELEIVQKSKGLLCKSLFKKSIKILFQVHEGILFLKCSLKNLKNHKNSYKISKLN